MDDVCVSRVRVFEVALPLRVPFTISGGSLAVRRSLIVVLEDSTGATGYGESAPFEYPFYSAETISSVKACLREVLAPRVVGRLITHPEVLRELLSDGVRGNRIARAGIDTAWWDLVARRRRLSVAALVSERLGQLGVAGQPLGRAERIDCGVALGIPEDHELSALQAEVRAAVRRGYRRVKFKVRPGWSVEPVKAAQQVLREDGVTLPMWVDANGAFNRVRDETELAELDRCGLLFVEQPFADNALWDSTAYEKGAQTPVCLDESLVSDDVARQLIEMSGPMVWNLKIQRMGGLEEACRVYARGVAADAKLWVGTMPETGVGALSALALAAHRGCVYPSDLEPSDRWYEPGTDLVELSMGPDGTMAVPDGPVEAPMEARMQLVFEIG